MVETPSMHVRRPEWTNHNSHNEVTGTITCVICEASYAPSNLSQRFLQVSPVVLESAYMSMCHFCFRCRRPACPECWDGIHGICGACVQETNLPFRTQVEPLDGTLFPPVAPVSEASPTSQALPIEHADPQGKSPASLSSSVADSHFQVEAIQENTGSSMFACVKHGKFHTSVSPSNGISPAETATIESTDKLLEPLPRSSQEQEQLTTSAMQADPHITVSLGNSLEAGLAPTLKASEVQTNPAPLKRRRSIVKKVELVLIAIVLLALLAIAIMIGLAEYFPAVNTFIDHLLHVDIRAEMAYLLHLVQQHL